jgi:hypothetical protein
MPWETTYLVHEVDKIAGTLRTALIICPSSEVAEAISSNNI